MKAPKVVATIGQSAQSLRIFEPIDKEARIDIEVFSPGFAVRGDLR